MPPTHERLQRWLHPESLTGIHLSLCKHPWAFTRCGSRLGLQHVATPHPDVNCHQGHCALAPNPLLFTLQLSPDGKREMAIPNSDLLQASPVRNETYQTQSE